MATGTASSHDRSWPYSGLLWSEALARALKEVPLG